MNSIIPFKYYSPMNEVYENGTITVDKLEGPMAGKQISDLEVRYSLSTGYDQS